MKKTLLAASFVALMTGSAMAGTVGVTMANMLGARAVACASTGNTSASLASYAAQAGMRGIVFLPAGKVAGGKLSQTLAYGATTVQIEGDFDDAMRLVEQVCNEMQIYLLNSLNPFRVFGYHRSNLLGIHSTFRTRSASKPETAREHSFSVSCSSSLYH